MELSVEVKKFLFPAGEDLAMFSHRTVSKEIADKIIEKGFKFYDSFQKTTDEIINDMVYLAYWDTLRKQYGGYIIVIALNKDFLNKIQKMIQPKFEAQQVLSVLISEDEEDADDEPRYMLPRQYVKGYINRKTGKITKNNEYDPSFSPTGLEQRINQLNST